MNDIYNKNTENLLKWIAHRLHGSCVSIISEDDLVQEGWIAALKAVETYDPSKAKLSSWIVSRAIYAMRTAIKESKKQVNHLAYSQSMIEYVGIEDREEEKIDSKVSCVWMLVKLLSPIAKDLIRLQLTFFARSKGIRFIRHDDVCKILGVESKDLKGIYNEVKVTLGLIRNATTGFSS